MKDDNLNLLIAAAKDSLGIEELTQNSIFLEYFMLRAYQEGETDRRKKQYGAARRRYDDVKL